MSEDNFDNEMKELQDQLDSVETDNTNAELDSHIQQMGFLWDRVHNKLKEDNICYHTKKPLVAEGQNPKDVKIHVVEASKTEPGISAFVALSDDAYEELLNNQKQQAEKNSSEEQK